MKMHRFLFLSVMLLSITLLDSSRVAAQRSDIRLSPESVLTYPLPKDIQIQAAARYGETTLAVWGTTVRRGDSIVNELRMQLLKGAMPVGEPQVLHSVDARPTGFVEVIASYSYFQVFWNDRRGDTLTAYTRRVTMDGTPAGTEERFGEGAFIGLGVARVGNALLWSQRVGGEERIYGWVVADSGDVPEPVQGPFSGMLQQVTAMDSVPGVKLLMRRGLPPLMLDSQGKLSELPTIVSKRFEHSYHLDATGVLAMIDRDTLKFFRSPFAALAYRQVVIPKFSGYHHVVSQYGSYALNPPFYVGRTASGIYRVFSVEIYVDVDVQYKFAGSWSYLRAMDLSPADTFSAPVVVGSTAMRPECRAGYEDWYWKRITYRYRNDSIACNCGNSATITFYFTKVVSGSDQCDDCITYYLDGYGDSPSTFDPLSEEYVATILPQRCPALSDPMVTRLEDHGFSSIRLSFADAGTSVRLRVPLAAITSVAEATLPGMMYRGDDLITTWKSVGPDSAIVSGVWNAAGWDSSRSYPLFTPLRSDSVKPLVTHTSSWTRETLPRLDNFIVADYVQRWAEDDSGRQNLEFSYHTFTPSSRGWIVARDTNPTGLGPAPFGPYLFVTDPNAATVISAVTMPIPVAPSIFYPHTNMIGFDTSGHVSWSIDSVWNSFDPFALIPVADQEFIAVAKRRAIHMRGHDTLGSFDFPSEITSARYQRLYGRYFLRYYYSDPSTLRLERYDFDGTLYGRSDINFSVLPSDLFVLQNPMDSSLTFLYGGKGGVRAAFVDRMLGVHGSDVPISITRDSVRNPAGVFRNDTLYAVWEDFRDGRSAIYGTGYPAERISAGVTMSGEREDGQFTASILPNPARGSTLLELHLPQSEDVDVSVAAFDGSVISSLNPGRLTSGRQRINLHSERLASGVYIVSVRAGGDIRYLRLIVIR